MPIPVDGIVHLSKTAKRVGFKAPNLLVLQWEINAPETLGFIIAIDASTLPVVFVTAAGCAGVKSVKMITGTAI